MTIQLSEVLNYAAPDILHSADAERVTIGSVLSGEVTLDELGLRVEDFYLGSNQFIWEALQKLAVDGLPTNDVALAFDRLGGIQIGDGDAVGKDYLLALAAMSSPNWQAYADIIHDRAIRRQLLRSSATIQEMALDLQTPAADLVAEQERTILALTRQGSGRALQASQLMSDYWDLMETRRAEPSGLLGVPTGLLDLDRATLGLQPGDVIILAGRPSMGKTALATWISYFTAVINDKGVLIFSLDMDRSKFPHRLLGMASGVLMHKIKLPHLLSDEEYERVAEAAGKIAQAPLLFDDTRSLTVDELCSRARRTATKMDLALIVVDYVQLLRASGRYNGNRNAEITVISRKLRALIGSNELHTPMIVVSQLNRQVEMRKHKRPILADLRDSGSLEQEADQVWGLYRDSYYYPSGAPLDPVEINILKNRDGETGIVQVLFSAANGVWYDCAREPLPAVSA